MQKKVQKTTMALPCSKKNMSVLITGITLKIMVIFTAWIVFIPLEQKTNLNRIKLCENKDFCNVIMPFEDTKILEFNQFENVIKDHLLFMQILDVQ